MQYNLFPKFDKQFNNSKLLRGSLYDKARTANAVFSLSKNSLKTLIFSGIARLQDRFNFVYKHRQTGETITKIIHPLKEY